MAKNVIAQKLGGTKQVLDDVETVGDVKTKLSATGYTASLNGEPAQDSDEVSDGDFVSLSQAVKGGI
jgi:sulfur carrier protein ThiS